MIDIPFDVLPTERGTRLDVFLSRRIKRMSRSLAANLIRSGMVSRSNAPLVLGRATLIVKPGARIFEGERIFLKRKKLDEAPIDDIVVPLVYSDARMLAVSKPGDLVVHPTASAYHRTLIRVLRTRTGERFLDLAHRIDKETSGLVLLARDREAGTHLKEQFASREVKKAYLAVVAGVPELDRMTLDQPMRLKPDSDSGVLMEIGGEGAQPAVTEVVVLSRGTGASLVEARPHTGRQHQIRLHLAHAGHPIVGDKLYMGGEGVFLRALRGEIDGDELQRTVGHPRQALHAWKASFAHPETRAEMTLSAPLPPDFFALMEKHGLIFFMD
jgi:23S rRNA pseudouridine1911/1915/1917 synthase